MRSLCDSGRCFVVNTCHTLQHLLRQPCTVGWLWLNVGSAGVAGLAFLYNSLGCSRSSKPFEFSARSIGFSPRVDKCALYAEVPCRNGLCVPYVPAAPDTYYQSLGRIRVEVIFAVYARLNLSFFKSVHLRSTGPASVAEGKRPTPALLYPTYLG